MLCVYDNTHEEGDVRSSRARVPRASSGEAIAPEPRIVSISRENARSSGEGALRHLAVRKLTYAFSTLVTMTKRSTSAPVSAFTFTHAQKVAGLVALGVVALLFHRSLEFLYVSWQRDEYSHGVLVPFLSIFLLWQRWPEIRRRRFSVMPAGLFLVLAGLVLQLLGSMAASQAVEAYALVVVIAGILLTLMGGNAFRLALGPLALLLLMVPIPETFYVQLSAMLQAWSLIIGVGILHTLGVSVLLNGAVMDLGARQLQVLDSASGLSFLLPLLALGTVVASVVRGRLWVRIVIVLSTIPIAILMHGVRVAMLGLQLSQAGRTFELLHLFEGWAVFMSCVVILMAEIWLLLLLSGDRRRLREALALDFPGSTAAEGVGNAPKPLGRILVITGNFSPEITGIGKYVGEMTAWMSHAGFDIRVITAPPYYPAWRVSAGYSSRRYSRERQSGALVYRCPLFVPRQPRGVTRMLHTISFALSTFPVALWQALLWRPNLVFVVEPPLTCAPAAILAAKVCGARAWLHVQDFEVDAAFDLGLLRNERLRRFALGTERWLMQRFDRVSSISAAMLLKLRDKGVDPERIGFFPNWVDTQLIRPLSGTNRLRAELGIDPETTVLLYSGNMGEKQGLGLIVAVAQMLAGSKDILFLFCGDGVAKRRTMDAVAGLANVRFIPLQPLERLNELLNLADIHLLPQRAEAEDLVMPSKLSAIMASGRPVVASARPGSDVSRAASAGGLVVPAGDPEAFGAAIRLLLENEPMRAELGKAGRAHALSNWDRELVLRSGLTDIRSFTRPTRLQATAPQGAVGIAVQSSSQE